MGRSYTASKVAACIGENPYEIISDTLEQLWMAEDEKSYKECVKKYRPTTSLIHKRKALYSAMNSDEAKSIKKIQNDGTKSTKEKVEAINLIEKKTISTEQHEQLIKYCKSQTSTKHGVKSEQSGLDLYARKTSQCVTKYNKLCTKTEDGITIRGKVDGIVHIAEGKFKIVEMKNRTRRLFHHVVGYEFCQVQCYLWMFDQKHCDLVEKYNDEINIFPLEKNNFYISTMLTTLQNFDNFLTNIQKDEKLQSEYFASEDSDRYIKDIICG